MVFPQQFPTNPVWMQEPLKSFPSANLSPELLRTPQWGAQLCTAQQPWLLPASLSSSAPQVQLSQQWLRSLPDLLSLPESLKQTAGNGKQAPETAG